MRRSVGLVLALVCLGASPACTREGGPASPAPTSADGTPAAAPAAAPPGAVSGAEIEATLQGMAVLPPPQKINVYQKLLEDPRPGLDEIFLVGLNEGDPELLRVVTTYFLTHHPAAAVEPLIDILREVQSDVEMRQHVGRVLASFGGPVVLPLLEHLRSDPPERWGDGGKAGIEFALGLVFRQGGPEALNRYLEVTPPEELHTLAPIAGDLQAAPIPADEQTIRLVATRLGQVRSPGAREGLLRLLHQIGKGAQLPTNLGILTPHLDRSLRDPDSLWAIYAAALVGSAANTPALTTQAAGIGARRFWALQALAMVGDDRAARVVEAALRSTDDDARSAAAFVIHHRLWRSMAPALRQAVAARPSLPLVVALGGLGDRGSRAALEGALAGSSREVQAAVLQALTPMADAELARRLLGWLEAELLAPARVGRLDLSLGPTSRVVEAALPILVGYGGEEAGPVLASLSGLWAAGAQVLPHARRLVGVLPAALPEQLRGAITSQEAPPLLPALFLLAGGMGGGEVQAALEEVLVASPQARWRHQAAVALFLRGSGARSAGCERALADGHFVEGPFPVYEFPIRRVCARVLEEAGQGVLRRPERAYLLSTSRSKRTQTSP